MKLNKDLMSALDHRKELGPGYAYKIFGGQSPYGMSTDFADGISDIDENEMSVTFPYASGVRRDGVGDLLEIGGIKLDRHRKNPAVLLDHGKHTVLPIGMAEDPNRVYTVHLDTNNKVATCKAYFYQSHKSYDHSVLCDQIFDMVAKRYIRGGSIGYQVLKAYPLQPDYNTGVPQGMHLQEVLQLEVSLVVMPANQDTVMKMLSFKRVCGKPLSPVLVKSLMGCGVAPRPKAQMLVSRKSTPEETPEEEYLRAQKDSDDKYPHLAPLSYNSNNEVRAAEERLRQQRVDRYNERKRQENTGEKSHRKKPDPFRVGDEVAFIWQHPIGGHRIIKRGVVRPGGGGGHINVEHEELGKIRRDTVPVEHFIGNITQNPELFEKPRTEEDVEHAKNKNEVIQDMRGAGYQTGPRETHIPNDKSPIDLGEDSDTNPGIVPAISIAEAPTRADPIRKNKSLSELKRRYRVKSVPQEIYPPDDAPKHHHRYPASGWDSLDLGPEFYGHGGGGHGFYGDADDEVIDLAHMDDNSSSSQMGDVEEKARTPEELTRDWYTECDNRFNRDSHNIVHGFYPELVSDEVIDLGHINDSDSSQMGDVEEKARTPEEIARDRRTEDINRQQTLADEHEQWAQSMRERGLVLPPNPRLPPIRIHPGHLTDVSQVGDVEEKARTQEQELYDESTEIDNRINRNLQEQRQWLYEHGLTDFHGNPINLLADYEDQESKGKTLSQLKRKYLGEVGEKVAPVPKRGERVYVHGEPRIMVHPATSQNVDVDRALGREGLSDYHLVREPVTNRRHYVPHEFIGEGSQDFYDQPLEEAEDTENKSFRFKDDFHALGHQLQLDPAGTHPVFSDIVEERGAPPHINSYVRKSPRHAISHYASESRPGVYHISDFVHHHPTNQSAVITDITGYEDDPVFHLSFVKEPNTEDFLYLHKPGSESETTANLGDFTHHALHHNRDFYDQGDAREEQGLSKFPNDPKQKQFGTKASARWTPK